MKTIQEAKLQEMKLIVEIGQLKEDFDIVMNPATLDLLQDTINKRQAELNSLRKMINAKIEWERKNLAYMGEC